ncbi:MAG: hypothetical protein IPM57_00010 [Oligoflexia bacterium]|nr:hypothetical protein [Oligoflexia bacterium]
MQKLIFIFIFLVPFSLKAETRLNFVGGINSASQEATSTLFQNIVASAKTYMAYGITADFKPASKSKGLQLGVSTGLLYVESGANQRFSVAGVTFNMDAKLPYIQVPLTLELWLSNIFSLGLGAYHEWGYQKMSQKGTQTFMGVTTTIDSASSFGEQNYETRSFGYMGKLQAQVPLGKKLRFVAIAIYQKNFLDISTHNHTTAKNINMMALGGFGLTL